MYGAKQVGLASLHLQPGGPGDAFSPLRMDRGWLVKELVCHPGARLPPKAIVHFGVCRAQCANFGSEGETVCSVFVSVALPGHHLFCISVWAVLVILQQMGGGPLFGAPPGQMALM